MFALDQLVRKNILDLQPYSSARDEYSSAEGVFLDANENPFGTLNRYPDPYQQALKALLSARKGLPAENIFIGNGSDEILDLCFRVFCTPGTDRALAFQPSYGMYEVLAGINAVELVQLPLNASFQIDLEALEPYLTDPRLKLLFLCSPNNPTANSLDGIEWILQRFRGLVVLDEAYIDFSSRSSFLGQLEQHPNLLVLQTFSKAWGLAAARVGMAFASTTLVALLNKVKPPYNVSALNQQAALQALQNPAEFEAQKNLLLAQRRWLEQQLATLPVVKKVYPSDANFLLVEVLDATGLYQQLLQQNIIVRNRHSLVRNCLRITVGSPEENQQLLQAIKNSTPA